MIRLVFAGEDAVLVPPADLALIWPYASELGELTLDKADGSTWWARRTEAEQEIQIAGKQLSKYISQRRRRRAPKLAPPGPVYERFVARFPYFTTVDQAKAVRDVLDDLASGHPMDRVICGDVGFGKTEVALRAAAAVVLSGKQVAIAVPTTVLARQHVVTFRKRFGGRSPNTGTFMVPATRGRAAVQPAPTPIREGRTRRGRCCVSSSSIRSMGSRASLAEFPDQLGVAELAGRRILVAAERAGLARKRLRAHDGRICARALHRLASGYAVAT
jgi:hypothetical protein